MSLDRNRGFSSRRLLPAGSAPNPLALEVRNAVWVSAPHAIDKSKSTAGIAVVNVPLFVLKPFNSVYLHAVERYLNC